VVSVANANHDAPSFASSPKYERASIVNSPAAATAVSAAAKRRPRNAATGGNSSEYPGTWWPPYH
jgi:hypothetical protein